MTRIACADAQRNRGEIGMAKTKLELIERNPKGAAAVIDWSVEEINKLRKEVQDLKTQIEQTVWDSCECWKKPVYRSGICTDTSCVRRGEMR